MGRKGSIQETPPSTPQKSTKTKRPYWAGTEEEYQPPSTSYTHTPPVPYTPSTEKKIPRKPVPTSGIPSPGFVYKPVEGNPYLPSPSSTKAPSSSYNPFKHKSVEGNPFQPSPSSSKVPNESYNSVKHAPRSSHDVQDKPLPPRPLSPGSIFNNGQPQRASAPKPGHKRKYSGSLSKGFDSIVRAASTAKHAMSKNAPDEAPGLKISSPIPGSFKRGGMTPNDDPEPLDLVGLEVAQANVKKYGQADHTLATTQALAVAGRASALAQDVRKAKRESPASPKSPETPTSPTHKIPRKPVPKPQPKSTAPAPAQNPRRVISAASDAVTTWGEIIDAGMDETWVKDAEAKQQVSNFKSEQPDDAPTRASRTNSVPDAQEESKRMSPAPLRISKRPSVGQSAASAPAPKQPYKSKVVPAVRCSNCGGKIAIAAVETHKCERYPPPRRSREAVYAANFPTDGPEEEDEVIVDTFVRSQHTSWVGQGKSKDGKTAWSHQDRVGSGSEGRRTLEGSDAQEGSSSLKKISVID